MVISKKKISKRCCISVIIRHDKLSLQLIYRSPGYSTGGPWSYSKIKEITI